jgi:hypothetical protein
VKKKVTAKFLFASIQSLFAFFAIILALLLRFDLINSQQALNIPGGAVDFYVVMLLIFGFVFIISGLFLIYDWWET